MVSNNFPLITQQRLQDFSEAEKQAYLNEYKRKKKSVFVAYLFLLPLGWHYAYLRKWGLQILCFLTLWGFLLWWFVDWFRVPSLVRNYNQDLSIALLKDFSWVSERKKTNDAPTAIQKWLKENPSASLNDFYKLNRNGGIF